MEQPRLEPYLGEEKPLVPPKSLGELCMELAQERMLQPFCILTPDGLGIMTGHYYFPGVRRDIQDLRERLWNRPHWMGRALVDLANPTLEASILFLRETHINPYKWRP
jgi:hypothetical protein